MQLPLVNLYKNKIIFIYILQWFLNNKLGQGYIEQLGDKLIKQFDFRFE